MNEGAFKDTFDRDSLVPLLNTKKLGRDQNLIILEEIDSTNEEIKRRTAGGAGEGLTIFADLQTRGKGRRGRTWVNPSGFNLAFSIMLRPPIPLEDASMITIISALSFAGAIRRITGEEALIKWPNDIVLHGKKTAGILTELVPSGDVPGYLILGTGINVNTPSFPEELKETATSLFLETGRHISRPELASECLNEFERRYEAFLKDKDLSGFKAEYESLCVNTGKEVFVLDPKGEYKGIAEGINNKGNLLVRREDGSLENIYAGEVSVRGIYGYA